MTDAAEYGLMLWDGKSKGTVNNMDPRTIVRGNGDSDCSPHWRERASMEPRTIVRGNLLHAEARRRRGRASMEPR